MILRPLDASRWALLLGACAVGLAGALAASCGSSGDDAAGFTPEGEDEPADAGPDRVDLSREWPHADPTPDASAAPPAFTPDGAAGAGGGPPAATCAGKSGAKGDRTLSLTSGGISRTSLLHVPASYDATKGLPLVLDFHGFGSDGAQQLVLSKMAQASDAHGFVVAHPYGIAASWNAGNKCCGTAWTDSVDDVAFVKALLELIEAEYCIDPRRVYATGMSNGGFLSHRLACEMADTFAAVAPVAGVLGFPDCHPSRPIPILHFHGTADPVVPYGGGNPVLDVGLGGTLDFPSVATSMDTWRAIDGCTAPKQTLGTVGDTTCVRWGGCQGDAELILCSVDGGGHTWPGGVPIPFLGKTSADVSATETMLGFFAAHPMPVK